MRRLWLILPASVVGGVVGGILLLHTGEKLFRSLVPWLILLASGLLAIQDPAPRLAGPTDGRRPSPRGPREVDVAPRRAGLRRHGGYFGAGPERHRPFLAGPHRARLPDAPERAEAGGRVGGQRGGGRLLPLLGPGRLAHGDRDGRGALVPGRSAGSSRGASGPRRCAGVVVSVGIAISIVYFVRVDTLSPTASLAPEARRKLMAHRRASWLGAASPFSSWPGPSWRRPDSTANESGGPAHAPAGRTSLRSR